MTVKQKFDRIDQSKLLKAQVDILKSMQTKTNNFKTKDKEALEKIEMGLDKIIAKLQESNPDALKSTARKTATAKTATKSTKKGKTAMQLAKEIRKPNESWNEAVKRAGSIMRGDAKQASKVVTSELQKLKAFVNRRKQLKGIAGTDLLRDSKRQAKPRGQRTSKDGNVYYEYRENRIDRLAPNYPKNAPLLVGGGRIQEVYMFQCDTKEIRDSFFKKLQDFMPNHKKEKLGNLSIQLYADENDDEILTQLAKSTKGVKKFADGGYNEGIEEDIDMTDDYVLRVNKGVEPKDRASMKEWMAKTNESREAMAYELGGAFMETDLAGHTGGGTGGLNANMPLSGDTGTHYTDLVGETGALSSAEMFKGGGALSKEENYKRRLKFISDDVKRVLENSPEKYLKTPVKGYENIETLLSNIEIASDYNDNESNNWSLAGGGNLSRDRKYVNYREDYEVRYSKGKGRHGYGNLKFANGGAMMANQQVIDNASQSYVNYYLGEGASTGMFARGGMMPKVSTRKHRND